MRFSIKCGQPLWLGISILIGGFYASRAENCIIGEPECYSNDGFLVSPRYAGNGEKRAFATHLQGKVNLTWVIEEAQSIGKGGKLCIFVDNSPSDCPDCSCSVKVFSAGERLLDNDVFSFFSERDMWVLLVVSSQFSPDFQMHYSIEAPKTKRPGQAERATTETLRNSQEGEISALSAGGNWAKLAPNFNGGSIIDKDLDTKVGTLGAERDRDLLLQQDIGGAGESLTASKKVEMPSGKPDEPDGLKWESEDSPTLDVELLAPQQNQSEEERMDAEGDANSKGAVLAHSNNDTTGNVDTIPSSGGRLTTEESQKVIGNLSVSQNEAGDISPDRVSKKNYVDSAIIKPKLSNSSETNITIGLGTPQKNGFILSPTKLEVGVFETFLEPIAYVVINDKDGVDVGENKLCIIKNANLSDPLSLDNINCKYLHNRFPLTIYITSEIGIMVRFTVTDLQSRLKPFALGYYSFKRNETSYQLSGERHVVSTPDFPKPYEPNQKYTWTITGPDGTWTEVVLRHLDLNFNGLDYLSYGVEGNVTRLNYSDMHRMKSARDTSSIRSGRSAGPDDINEVVVFQSSKIIVEFSSYYHKRLFQDTGFLLKVKSIEKPMINSSSTMLTGSSNSSSVKRALAENAFPAHKHTASTLYLYAKNMTTSKFRNLKDKIKVSISKMGNDFCADMNLILDREILPSDVIVEELPACRHVGPKPYKCFRTSFSIYTVFTLNDTALLSTESLINRMWIPYNATYLPQGLDICDIPRYTSWAWLYFSSLTVFTISLVLIALWVVIACRHTQSPKRSSLNSKYNPVSSNSMNYDYFMGFHPFMNAYYDGETYDFHGNYTDKGGGRNIVRNNSRPLTTMRQNKELSLDNIRSKGVTNPMKVSDSTIPEEEREVSGSEDDDEIFNRYSTSKGGYCVGVRQQRDNGALQELPPEDYSRGQKIVNIEKF